VPHLWEEITLSISNRCFPEVHDLRCRSNSSTAVTTNLALTTYSACWAGTKANLFTFILTSVVAVSWVTSGPARGVQIAQNPTDFEIQFESVAIFFAMFSTADQIRFTRDSACFITKRSDHAGSQFG
jgi:hypothetical protein